jgi:hypothetical protein
VLENKGKSRFYDGDSGEIHLPRESFADSSLSLASWETDYKQEHLRQEILSAFPFLLRGTCEPFPFRSVLREREIIEEYIASLEDSITHRPIGYVAGDYEGFIQKLSSSIEPMTSENRVSIVIPVYNEEKVIKRCIEEWSHQTVPTKFEIIFVVTGRVGYRKDSTVNIISQQKGKVDYPIHLIDEELQAGFDNVGFARKIGHDVAMIRSLGRDYQQRPLYFMLDDADCFCIQPCLVEKTIERFDRYPSLDMLKRQVTRDPWVSAEHDLLKLERTLSYLTEIVFFPRMQRLGFVDMLVNYADGRMTDGQFWLRTPSSGVDTSITAEALALIKGGFESVKRSEDLVLAPKISILRGRPNQSGVRMDSATMEKQPIRTSQDIRRFIQLLEKRFVSDDFKSSPYADFGDESSITAIRDAGGDRSSAYKGMSNITKLSDSTICWAVDNLMSYYTEHFFPYIFPRNREFAIERYASFLSAYLVGTPGGIVGYDGKIKLKNVAALRLAFEDYHSRLAKGEYRFQRCSTGRS